MIKAFRNLSIGKKLYTGFSLVLVILIALSAITYVNFSKQQQTTEWNYHTYDVLMELEAMLASMINMETGQRGFALTGSEASLEPYHTGLASFQEHFARVKSLTSDNPKQQQLLDDLLAVQQEWQLLAENSIELRKQVNAGTRSMDDVIRDEQAGRGKQSFDRFRAIIGESEAMEYALLEQRVADNEARVVVTNTTIVAGTVIAVLFALVIAFAITRQITRPIAEVTRAATQMAQGELDIDIRINSRDEMGVLAQAFMEMSDKINEVLGNIRESAEQVNSGSRQVSDSSVSLSQGSAEQSSAIEELTSTLEEIGSQTNHNAERAENANKLSVDVREMAVNGDHQMKLMLQSMDEINTAAGNISKIIKVIDEIAFQTNILALNAAVEAARAGQHGKGFAVVAEEVRNLAARSASAARETTDLIEGSIQKAEHGTTIAADTAQALNEIVNGITEVADLVDQIAMASREQATGIEQVNQAIMQVSQVTQTNSAISQETASASEELSSQAEMLMELVSRFKLKNSGWHQTTAPLGPDVAKLLDDMPASLRNDWHKAVQSEPADRQPGEPRKIALSDQEFGKY